MSLFEVAKRWMYRDQHPNWAAKALNKVWEAIASSGMVSNYAVTLEVTGRKSGKVIAFPVVLALVDGHRYIVSMLGDDVQWVRNVRAAGGRASIRSGQRKKVVLEEIAIDQRAPIIKDYLQRANGARPHIPVNKDAPLEAFEKIAANYPVFRIYPTSHL